MAPRQAPSTVGLGEPGDLSAEPGSPLWAIAVRGEMILSLSDTRSNHDRLRWYRDTMIEHQGYRHLAGPDGKPFATFRAFCQAKQPWGLGYDETALDAIIAESKRTVEEIAHEAKPLRAEAGRPAGNNVSNTNIISKASDCDANYYTARIARDHPAILERMQAGEYRSVMAASVEAGIVQRRVTCLPTVQGFARAIRRHLSPDEVTALIDLLTTGEVSS